MYWNEEQKHVKSAIWYLSRHKLMVAHCSHSRGKNSHQHLISSYVLRTKKNLILNRSHHVFTRKGSQYSKKIFHHSKKSFLWMFMKKAFWKTVQCYETTSSLQAKCLVMRRASCYYYKRNISLIWKKYFIVIRKASLYHNNTSHCYTKSISVLWENILALWENIALLWGKKLLLWGRHFSIIRKPHYCEETFCYYKKASCYYDKASH